MSTWRNEHAHSLAPSARAASTYSSSRTTSTEPRTIRAVCGVVATESAITTLVTEAPSTALTIIASTIDGKAIRASIRRMSGLSSRGKNPAVAPISVPNTPVASTTMAPIASEMRAPSITRRQDVAAEMVGAEPVEGVGRRAGGRGSCCAADRTGRPVGARRDERKASEDERPPIRNERWRKQTRERLARPGCAAARCRAIASALTQPHARIDDGVEDVDGQVHGEIDRREEQQAALDHGEVARPRWRR